MNWGGGLNPPTSLTCKNRLPYNLYCVGGDIIHSVQSSLAIPTLLMKVIVTITFYCDTCGKVSLWLWKTRGVFILLLCGHRDTELFGQRSCCSYYTTVEALWDDCGEGSVLACSF